MGWALPSRPGSFPDFKEIGMGHQQAKCGVKQRRFDALSPSRLIPFMQRKQDFRQRGIARQVKLGVNWHVPRFPQGAGWRYAVALVGFLLSFLLREVLSAWLHDRDFVVFVPAIILIAFFADLGPAILTTLLSGIAVWYFFTPPFHSFRLDVDGVTGLATFLLSSAVAISLIHWLRVTNARLRAERTRAEQAESRIAADLRAMTQLVQLSHRLVRERTKIDDCLNGVIETALSVSGADKGNLQLLNSNSGTLTIAAQRGFETPFLRYFANVREDATAWILEPSATELYVNRICTSLPSSLRIA